jgi:lipoprotein-anchoring transpeptidase ErfK/SrfK
VARAGAAAAAAALALALGGCAEDGASSAEGAPPVRPVPRAASALERGAPPPRAPGAGPVGPVGARVLRRTLLRTRPHGPVIRALSTRTNWRSYRVLAVVARRPGWLGVLTHLRGNGRAAWIPADAAELVREPYALEADLSARRMLVRHEGRVVRRIPVAVGRPGSPTPTGRYAITDALELRRGSAYGCCAFALTGRQPNVPQGWTGGDRLAIHGTSDPASIGTAASAGCLRAPEADLRWMLARLPLGTVLRIRA